MRITFESSCSYLTAGKRLATALALSALCVASGKASATAIYDPGPLNFSTVDQSMWGTGAATKFADSVFVGPQWTNRSVGLGGIIGSLATVTVNTNPVWWAWKACKETIGFPCGGEPSKGQIQEVIDTRTGARVDLTTSGKFGLEFGYTLDSGSVNATANFSASAVLPSVNPKKGEFFSLNPDSSLDNGSISSQSPKAEAFINAIAQLSGSVTATACLIPLGCAAGGTNLPSLNAKQPILSIDPNSLKVVPDLLPPENPGGPRQPLAEVKLLNQTLTLQGALDASLTPSFKLSTSQFTLAETGPPGLPDLTFDLASIEFKIPNIATTSGPFGGSPINSSGRDDVIKARVDIDGVAAMNGFPPTGIGLTLIDTGPGGFKVALQFDALDIDAGPDIGITQDFELEPTLMVSLAFSHPVMIGGAETALWAGEWDLLPEIALLETTTITPTFWLEAMLTNTIGIDLGLTGTMDILKFTFTASAGGINLLGTSPVSLNSLLGLGNQLFSTPKLEFPIWDTPFQLEGFESIDAAPFTITVQTAPTPGTLVLLLAALGAAAFAQRRRGATPRAKASARR